MRNHYWMMAMALGIGLAGLVFLLFFWRLALGGLDRVVDRAVASGKVEQILEVIARRPRQDQPTAFNHAIRRLWDAYERGLATALIKELAAAHHESRIAQYWLAQVLTAEPGIAEQELSKQFLETYYQPEVAATCGPVG